MPGRSGVSKVVSSGFNSRKNVTVLQCVFPAQGAEGCWRLDDSAEGAGASSYLDLVGSTGRFRDLFDTDILFTVVSCRSHVVNIRFEVGEKCNWDDVS